MSQRHSLHGRRILALAAGLVLLPATARATIFTWNNAGGNNDFHNRFNWAPAGGPPDDFTDAAIFDGTQIGPNSFTVNLSQNAISERLNVAIPNGVLTLNLNSFTYTLDSSNFTTVSVGAPASSTGLVLTNGTMAAVDLSVGDSLNSTDGVTVSTGATLSLTRSLRIGSSGRGALLVQNGGNLLTRGVFIGSGMSNRGSLDIVGAGSLLRDASSIQVGNGGPGQLQVFSGGQIEGREIIVGTQAGGEATALISGAGALMSGETVTVGLFAPGALTVSGGARVESTRVNVASQQAGSILVTGAGSVWAGGSSRVDVGFNGSGSLSIEQGAGFSTTGMFSIGGTAQGTGDVTLADSGSSLLTGDLHVGGSSFGPGGTGTLTVAGGTLTAGTTPSQVLRIWRPGTLQFDGGSILAQDFELAGGTFNWGGGTLTVADDAVFRAGAHGTGLSIGPGRTLAVADQTVIESGVALTLDGGTFSTGTLFKPGTLVLRSGVFRLTGTALTVGAGQLFGPLLELPPGLTFNATSGAVTIQSGGVLALTGGSFSSTGPINNSGEIQLASDLAGISGGPLVNEGLVLGNGRIGSPLTNAAAGVVRASDGQRLVFGGAGNSNAGSIDLVGGTIEFAGSPVSTALTNTAGGRITGRGTLIFGGAGLINEGKMLFSGGFTDLYGGVNQTGAGRVIISGGSQASFYDDFVHSGAEVRIASASRATFFGSVSGAGPFTGPGTVDFEGMFSPGASPAIITFGGNLTLGPAAVLTMEIGGLTAGTQHDQLNVASQATLDGTLDVQLIDGFVPRLGDRFVLMNYASRSGTFSSVDVPALPGGLEWSTEAVHGDTQSILAVSGGPGDSVWIVDSDGDASVDANWSDGSPNGAGLRAILGSAISAGRTVTLDLPTTLGGLHFDNANAYSVAGSQALALEATAGSAMITVASGNHRITAAVGLAGDAVVSVADSSSLALEGILAADGRVVTKNGAGLLRSSAIRAAELVVDEGSVLILPDGTPAGASAVDELTLAGMPGGWTATLDLSDNGLVIHAGAGTADAVRERIENQIAHARNFGAWDQPGLSSSAAADDPLQITGLAVLRNEQLGSLLFTEFDGIAVDENAVLVKYTYNGDMDLNGLIDIDDYFLIDTGFLAFQAGLISSPTYRNGDLDFNDLIDIDDYFLIDTAFLGQSVVLLAAQSSAVPEAGMLSAAALAFLALLPKRRRRD